MQLENKNFWLNLEKIQNVLLKTDEEFAAYMGLDYAQFIKQKTVGGFLPLNAVYECAEKLNFHFVDLLVGNFCTDSIQSYLQGKCKLSERYALATYSSTRQTLNILKYLESSRGERAKINLLRKFQISESFFTSTQSKANVHLITDMVQYLRSIHYFTDEELIRVGQMTPFTGANQDMARELSNKKYVYELLE
jgi:hypothetical protein